jgi:3-isopropylmalate dehydrogenase
MAMLLEWLGRRHNIVALSDAASAVEKAVHDCLNDPIKHTADLGGSLGTKGFGNAVVEKLA